MTPKNILEIKTHAGFREWLMKYHSIEKECWIAVKRGKTPPVDALWCLDAVEEALCFGWIESTVKNVDGVTLQRFGHFNRRFYIEIGCTMVNSVILYSEY